MILPTTAHAILLSLAFINPVPEGAAPLTDLGEQFVEAIRNKDIVAYSQCWVSYRRLVAIVRSAGDKLPPEAKEELARMKPYYVDRNRHVAHSFDVLVEHLSRGGDLAALRLVAIEGRVKERHGMRAISTVHVTLGIGDARYEVGIDDAIEDDGSWFFSDKPMSLTLPGGGRVSLKADKPR